jgi:hypothetical protein
LCNHDIGVQAIDGLTGRGLLVYILKLLRGPAPPKFLTDTSPRVLWGERAVALLFRTKEEAVVAAERLRSHGTVGVEYR